MTEEVKKLLKDIESSIKSIDIHLERRRDFHEYTTNITKQRAVERELSIIGEAMNKLLKESPLIMLSYSRTIVDLRNRIIHAYDNINNNIIWRIIMKDIPLLLSEVGQLLDEKKRDS